MKHLIKNNQIVQSGIQGHFTRENGEAFWGGYENRTDIHYEDGWREEVIPEYDPLMDELGEIFYSQQFDVVTYEIVPRKDMQSLDHLKTQKIRQVKMYTRDLLFDTDFYIVRRAETGKSVPQTILNERQAIRVWQDAQEVKITTLQSLKEVMTFEVNY